MSMARLPHCRTKDFLLQEVTEGSRWPSIHPAMTFPALLSAIPRRLSPVSCAVTSICIEPWLGALRAYSWV
jgi:hypothetical protein